MFGAMALGVLLIGNTVKAEDWETTGLTDKAIKVGVMGPFTGNASSYSKTQIGLMAYFKHINDQGGIHGRKFEMFPEDTACAPAKGIAAAKKLVHQDKVFYLHGNSCSAVAMAVKPTVSPTGIPWIIAHAVNPKITMPVNEKKSIYHGVPAGPAYGSTMGEFVMSKPGAKRIAMITHTNDWAKAYCDPAIKVIKATGGEIVLEQALERGQTDATAQVLKLKGAKPDFILGCLYEAETVIFLRDAKKYGLRIPVMGTAGTDLENTLERLGDKDAVKDYYVLHAFVDKVDGPKMKKWNDIILKYNPDETITGFSAVSMASGVAAVKALQNVGPDLTRSKFIAELDKIKGLSTGILACDITWSATDRHGCKKSAVAGFVDGNPTVLSSWGKPW
ncbi:MAG: branched-chain amino acid ABC transporter substrate-binding protein [Magnetovibrio sp.]|nr:branched-chain amino acid ABC transporter substrate-binding protein [Magnetovibrio sp.]